MMPRETMTWKDLRAGDVFHVMTVSYLVLEDPVVVNEPAVAQFSTLCLDDVGVPYLKIRYANSLIPGSIVVDEGARR